MKEEIRKERMEKYGSITWCAERNTMCFGILTEDGTCKHETCLHDDPEWLAQQERIEMKRKATIEHTNEAAAPEETKATKESRNIKEEIWKKIHAWEDKANSLYRAGERQAADALMNKSGRARRELWKIENEK